MIPFFRKNKKSPKKSGDLLTTNTIYSHNDNAYILAHAHVYATRFYKRMFLHIHKYLL